MTKLERKEVLEISKANFIDENGNYIKEVSGSFILSRSDETKLDVAIVKENPLTVKLVDFGKILFEQKKKKKLQEEQEILKIIIYLRILIYKNICMQQLLKD